MDYIEKMDTYEQVLVRIMPLKKGKVLDGKYKIKRVLSSTEMSIVYAARHLETGELVALKELFPRSLVLRDLDDTTVICRKSSLKFAWWKDQEIFFNEIAYLQRLEHKNIVRYIDHFQENGTLYLVTAYSSGRTLDRIIDSQRTGLSPILIFQVFLPLLEALSYMHAKGILHGDIKPGNLILTRAGTLVLIDFGSSVSYRSSSATRRIATTAHYSPLELHSEQAALGPGTDFYSFSALLYMCVCQAAPVDVTKRIIMDSLLSVDRRGKVGKSMAYCIMRGLQLERKRRLSSPRVFKLALLLEAQRQRMKENLHVSKFRVLLSYKKRQKNILNVEKQSEA